MAIPSSSTLVASSSSGVSTMESPYLEELGRKHPFCANMFPAFQILALYNDCVNRIKEIAKDTIFVIYPPSDKYVVDQKKDVAKLLIDSQLSFNIATTLLCANAINAFQSQKSKDIFDGAEIQETIKQVVDQHQKEITDAKEVYEDALRYISSRKTTSATARVAVKKITSILETIKKMTACIPLLRKCSDIDSFDKIGDYNSQDRCMDQNELEEEINFVRSIIANLWMNKDFTAYKSEFLSVSNTVKRLNQKFTPSDMKDIGTIVHFSRKIISEFKSPKNQSPIFIFSNYLILQTHLSLQICVDRSLKERKIVQINLQALSFCNTCINLLPQLYSSFDEESQMYYLPLQLEGIFFMKKALSQGISSLSLFDYYDARERVQEVIPFIESLTVFIEKEVPNLVQTIERRLAELPRPISEKMLVSMQNDIDELITPTFLRLFLLRLLLESVEKLFVSRSGERQKFQLSSTSVVCDGFEGQSKGLRWYEDLEELMGQLNVSAVNQRLERNQAINSDSTTSSIVVETSEKPSIVEAEPHFPQVSSPVSSSTRSDRDTGPRRTAKRAVKQPSNKPKGKNVTAALASSKKTSSLSSQPIGARPSSDASERVLQIAPSDLQRKYRHLEKLLQSNGFLKKSTKGSHEKWIHQTNQGKMVIVPRSSSTIPVGTLSSILKEANSILQEERQRKI